MSSLSINNNNRISLITSHFLFQHKHKRIALISLKTHAALTSASIITAAGACRAARSTGTFHVGWFPYWNPVLQNHNKWHKQENIVRGCWSAWSWMYAVVCIRKALCINNAHCASVSICFVAGDKTGSKLFLLVQQQQQQQPERSYGREERSFLLRARSAQHTEECLPSQRWDGWEFWVRLYTSYFLRNFKALKIKEERAHANTQAHAQTQNCLPDRCPRRAKPIRLFFPPKAPHKATEKSYVKNEKKTIFFIGVNYYFLLY